MGHIVQIRLPIRVMVPEVQEKEEEHGCDWKFSNLIGLSCHLIGFHSDNPNLRFEQK